MSPVWDLPWLAAELQDWYNRNSQIWAVKELCQSFLTGNQPHTHTRRALDPSTFWGATIASNKSPLIYLKLRKLSPSLHPPAPGSSKERGGGKKTGMSCPAWIPEAAPGCLEPAPASPSTHGVVVLCDHRRAHKVALTPIHFSTLVGKYARHRQAPREKERRRSVVGTEEERAAHPKRTLILTHVAPASPAQPSPVPYPATKDSSSSQHTSYCARVPLSPQCRSCKSPQKMLLDSGWSPIHGINISPQAPLLPHDASPFLPSPRHLVFSLLLTFFMTQTFLPGGLPCAL